MKWGLEKQSKAWRKGIRASGVSTVILVGAGTGVSVAALSAGAFAGGSGASAIGVIGTAGVVVLPVIGVSYLVGNTRGRSKIEKEFDRRRLVLPVAIPTGQVVQGSLFFPISPGPKCLILHYQMGEEEHDMEFDLSSSKTLHIKEEDARLPNSSSLEPTISVFACNCFSPNSLLLIDGLNEKEGMKL